MELFLCWQNDNSVLGVATSEDSAKKMCSEFGDSYMSIESDVAEREGIETAPLVIYQTGNNVFLSYTEAKEQGYNFYKVEKHEI